MKKTNDKKGMSGGAMVAAGASVLAVAAASYYFFGPDGQKHRNKMKGWMIKMKGEIVEKMENAKEMSEEAYHTIVDKVAGAYLKNKGLAEDEVSTYVTLLKKQWKGFSGGKKPAAKKAASSAKKTVKKAAKKSA